MEREWRGREERVERRWWKMRERDDDDGDGGDGSGEREPVGRCIGWGGREGG